MSDQKDIDVERVQKSIDTLGEFYGAVQIFVSRDSDDGDGGTINLTRGTGNWFARYGHVKNWINEVEENTRDEARRRNEE